MAIVLSLNEQDRALLLLLTPDQRDSVVLSLLLGEQQDMDRQAEIAWKAIFKSCNRREKDRERKRSAEIPRKFHGNSTETPPLSPSSPPFLPPSPLPPVPPISPPPIIPPPHPLSPPLVPASRAGRMRSLKPSGQLGLEKTASSLLEKRSTKYHRQSLSNYLCPQSGGRSVATSGGTTPDDTSPSRQHGSIRPDGRTRGSSGRNPSETKPMTTSWPSWQSPAWRCKHV